MQTFIDALARQGIAADITRTRPQIEKDLATVRLRFDKVALRFIRDVQAALHEVVPEGRTLIVTITAPIRMALKTVAALEERVRTTLARRSARIDLNETINGNQIRVRLVNDVSNRAKVIGFVHNRDCDPEILFRLTQTLLRVVTSTK